MIITTEIFINEIYNHLQKICLQNKTKLPPRDAETLRRIALLVESSIHEINHGVLNRTRKNIYKEWKKDQRGFLYVHKGFHTSFRYALEQSIPRTLEQINEECPGLHMDLMERLEKVNTQHRILFKEEMIFQKGTAEFVHTYGRLIPTDEFLFRTNSGLRKSRTLQIPDIERWSYISGSLWEYLTFNKIEINRIKISPLSMYPLRKASEFRLSPFEAIDNATDS